MNSFSEVVGAWETVAIFADDVGVPYVTAAAWRQRNSIPAQRWSAVVKAAQKRGIEGVTLEILAAFAAAPRDEVAA